MSMRNCRQYFYGIQKKILLTVTLILSILFVVTYAGINQIVKANTYESLSGQYAYLNDRILMSFEKIQDDLDQLTSDFILNAYVQKSLTNQPFTASDVEMMKKSLAFLNRSFLDYYVILDNKGNMYSPRNISLDLNTFQNSTICKSLGEEYSKTKLLWTRDVIFGTNEMSFFVVRYIHEMNSPHDPGLLILKLNDSILDDIKESITDERLMYFMLDGNEEVCFGQLPGGAKWDPEDERNREILWQEIMVQGEYSGQLEKGISRTAYHEGTQFTIITYAPEEVSNEVVREIQFMMGIVFIATYSLAVVSVIVFAHKFTRPIKYVSDTMSSFDESRLESRIDLNTNTELDHIGQAYNSMVKEVRSLMENVKKKEQELWESELQSLIYQIRPHFLYNTLDTIYMLARIQKEETIMKMIESLSCFFRINLSNGKQEIPVEKELEHVSAYLEIQKIRNAELFTYEIDLEESVSSLMVMKMILQPVAENCIKYGFQDIYEGGVIRIRAYQEDGYLSFSVENNGKPIEQEQLDKLNKLETISIEEIDQVIRRKNGGYGICNVVKRLRVRYHDKIRFYYVRKESGTECIIQIELDQAKESEKGTV
ncbi:MAG: histidine kinase [Lachnospiraceae bacterium]|nr:histidine kinase [Lachnospiraceae bacterium]